MTKKSSVSGVNGVHHRGKNPGYTCELCCTSHYGKMYVPDGRCDMRSSIQFHVTHVRCQFMRMLVLSVAWLIIWRLGYRAFCF